EARSRPFRTYPIPSTRVSERFRMNDQNAVSRRSFLGTAGLATGAVAASGAFPHPAVGAVKGANEKLNIAIFGPGGRAQEHIRILNRLKGEGKPVDMIALADV